MRIPVSKPDLRGREAEYAADAVRSTWISSTGPFLDRFEREWAQACGAKHALGVCNGTAALHLALLGLDVRPGDEVLVPGLTYVAVANAVRYVGGVPVFVDVDRQTWCIDPKLVEAAITPLTRGIIAVHSYGHPADMDAINRLAAVHGLWVVEDAAEAHGACYRDRVVGGLSRVGVTSFYGNKILSAGEGGAVMTSDDQLAVRLRVLRGQGVDPDRRYYFPVVGHNFRMTNVAAAILCAQLERFDQILRDRRRVFARYDEHLGRTQPCADWAEIAPWMYCGLLGHRRDHVVDLLRERGIETRPFFYPLHELPPYRGCARGNLPVSVELARSGINLPTYPELPDSVVDEICEIVRRDP